MQIAFSLPRPRSKSVVGNRSVVRWEPGVDALGSG